VTGLSSMALSFTARNRSVQAPGPEDAELPHRRCGEADRLPRRPDASPNPPAGIRADAGGPGREGDAVQCCTLLPAIAGVLVFEGCGVWARIGL
jgi:hypothetical protein